MFRALTSAWCSSASKRRCRDWNDAQRSDGEQAAAHWVRDMFGRVAGRYDLLNHLLSFNLDKRWRRARWSG